MPVTPTYPGVYIEEIPSGVHTITGVATSIAAFLGRASKGPINKAVRILSLSDYVRQFGDRYPKSDLADSVRLFFANGGTDCYVIRLAKGAKKAQIVLKSLNGEKVLLATAKADGVWANTVRLEVDYNTQNPDETFNLKVIQEADGKVVTTEPFSNLSMNPDSSRFAPTFVTQSSDLIELSLHSDMEDPGDPGSYINTIANSFPGFSQARRPLGDAGNVKSTLETLINTGDPADTKSKFEISVNDAPFVTVDLSGLDTSASLNSISNEIRDRINDALATVTPVCSVTCQFEDAGGNVHHLLTITSDSDDQSSVRVRRASSNDVTAALMLGIYQGGVEMVRWSYFRPAPTATLLELGSSIDGTEILDSIAGLTQNAIKSIIIDGVAVALALITTAPEGTDYWFQSKSVSGSPHDNNDGVCEKLRIIAQAINAEAGLSYEAEVWGYHLALKKREGTINAEPTAITTTDVTFSDGLTKNVRQYSLGTASESGPDYFVSDGVDGTDGTAPGAAEYIGNPTDQTGLYALDPVDLFNLMVIPGDDEVDQTVLNAVWGSASTYCEEHRAFLLIDSPKGWVNNSRPEVVQNTGLVKDLRSLVVKDYSAVFYPRLYYVSNGLSKKIGPAGAIAGLMARTDSARGVWKAPSGTEADIRSILGLEVDLTDMENGVLNKLGVNCLRVFPSGIVNWGARTMDGADDNGSEWKYIPIRRLALFLEESLFRGTKWVVFEPNDEPLWAKIRMNVGAFMMRLFRQGAFQGTKPDKAFFVKCDEETTPQSDRDLGIVNIVVGFAPLKPAEFVIIKIQQIAGEL